MSGGYLTEAAQQIDEIGAFIAYESVDGALVVRGTPSRASRLCPRVRDDLTDRPVKFRSVFSYLIVYDPARRPLPVVAVPTVLGMPPDSSTSANSSRIGIRLVA